MVDLASKNLFHDKLRFLITIAGVAFAVTLVFVQVGLFLGLLDNASITIEHLGADLWVTSHNTPNIDFAQTFSDNSVQRVRSIPGVARADNLIVWFMTMALPTGAQEGVLAYALEDFTYWGMPWNVVSGRLDDLRRGDYLFLDGSATKRFGEFAPGDYRELLGRRMKIIGRTEDALSFSTTPITFLDFDRAQGLSEDLRGKTTYILVDVAPGADVEAVRREIARRLPYNDVYTKEEWADRSRAYWVESTGLGLNLAMTIFLGCLVGLVVVAQTLYTSTMEHIKEFGTVKAIGGSNADIYRILAKQAAISAVFGFALGALPVYFLIRPAMAKIDLKLILELPFLVTVAVGTLLLCLASAMISFRKVARIDPALVFRG